jgi:predicted permease
VSFIDAVRHRMRVLLRPREFERDLAEEVEHHLELDSMQFKEDDALHRARRRFGNVTAVKESTRAAAGLERLDIVRQDVRFALRTFRRAPGFTAVTVGVLAIGIGANTALFSAVDAILLRPLPFARPEQIMKVSLTSPARANRPASDDRKWSYPKFVTFRDAQTIFRDVTLYAETEASVSSSEQTERVPGETIGARYLPLLGVRPAIGRNFGADEDSHPDGPRVMLVSDALWKRLYGGDSSVLGSTLVLNAGFSPRSAVTYTIVGILPAGFRGLSGRAEFWVPVMAWASAGLSNPRAEAFQVIGRLNDGRTAAQAKSGVRMLGALVGRAFPQPGGSEAQWGGIARELNGTRADPLVRRSLLILLGAAGVVLLIACANVANLFLVRAASRKREIAARLALGASRGRVVRQLLTESVMLAVLGGTVGLAIAWWGTRVLDTLDPTKAFGPRQLGGLGVVSFQAIALDPPAFAFAAALTIVTGIAFGLVPALHATRSSLSSALNEGAASQAGGRTSGLNGRYVLAVVEITAAIMLLVGAGLMLQSLAKRLGINRGYIEDHVLTLRFTTGNRSARDSVAGLYAQLLERIAALPGVQAAGLANCAPLAGNCSTTMFTQRDGPAERRVGEQDVEVHWVTAGWFAAMRAPLKRGRVFARTDLPDRQKVVMVNEAAAQRFWPGQDPIGRAVSIGQGFSDTDTAYVIGVVGDVRYERIESPPTPAVYLSYTQSAIRGVMLFVRTAGDPLVLVPAVRRALHDISPESPVFDLRTMQSRVAEAMAPARFNTILLVLFGAVALILAAVGTYGVVSFGVAQRTREIGIRVALGATRAEIIRTVIGQGLGLAIAGTVFGSAAAFATTGVLRSLLYEVGPTDPATFLGIALLLTGVVVIASWLPARRAARVDPTIALRQ